MKNKSALRLLETTFAPGHMYIVEISDAPKTFCIYYAYRENGEYKTGKTTVGPDGNIDYTLWHTVAFVINAALSLKAIQPLVVHAVGAAYTAMYTAMVTNGDSATTLLPWSGDEIEALCVNCDEYALLRIRTQNTTVKVNGQNVTVIEESVQCPLCGESWFEGDQEEEFYEKLMKARSRG